MLLTVERVVRTIVEDVVVALDVVVVAQQHVVMAMVV